MDKGSSSFVIHILTVLLLFGSLAAHESLDRDTQALQFEETVFEVNGSPLYVLNARVRVKNVGQKGRRARVHFFCRLTSKDGWTRIGERPLAGVLPGNSSVCDLVTSSEGLPIVDSAGEVHHCQYRIEVHYGNEVAAEEGEFHPACLFDDHDDHDHHDHEH